MFRRSVFIVVLLAGFALAWLLLQPGATPPASSSDPAKPSPEKMPVESPQATSRPPVQPVIPAVPAPAVKAPDAKADSGFEVWLGRLAAAVTAQDHAQILQEAAAREPRARFLGLIGRQLRSAKTHERRAALQALSGFPGEDAIPLYKQGLADEETSIREITRRLLRGLDSASRIEVLKGGLSSPYEAVRIDCFRELAQETSKQVIPAMIHALASNNPATAKEAARQLAVRLGPSAPAFKQPSAAASWWEQNANRYGDDMRRLD